MSVPLPNHPSGRVWARDPVTGKWVNELVEASKEELAKADAAIRREKSHDKLGDSSESKEWKSLRSSVNSQKQSEGGVPSPSGGISSIHLNYAKRLSGNDSYEEPIAEEGSSCQEQDMAEDGVKYHYVKPSECKNTRAYSHSKCPMHTAHLLTTNFSCRRYFSIHFIEVQDYRRCTPRG